jgi:Tol biopolymer transport system component
MQFSPDEQVVATGYDGDESGGTNIWTIDLRRRNVVSRLTFGLDRDSNPAWSPNGRRIAFNSTRNSEKSLYDMAASGGDEKLLIRATPELGPLSVSDWSKDGRFLIFNKDRTRDLWVLPLDGTDRKPILLVRPPSGHADQPNFSPNGHFVAYNSDESSPAQVYVVPFPPTGEKWQVSAGGGVQPRWRGDGREIVYLAPDGTMMAANVSYDDHRFRTDAPHPLFKTTISPLFQTEQFAMTRDGQRFLIMKPLTSSTGVSLMIVLNWKEELKQRVPSK